MTSARQRCPCHSGRTYGACCRPAHRGDADPRPDELMRARYAAYALEKVRFVQDTSTEIRADREAWSAEILQFCRAVSFDGLEVGPTEAGEDPDSAYVTFHAILTAVGVDVGFRERSRFIRTGTPGLARWRYASGERLEP